MSQSPLGKLGKYEIRQELGKGAMGVVYLAYDPVLERQVALKVMASTIVSDDELRQRFEKEAKGVARLQHPNIVTIYDLGYDQNGSPFIAMELLKGTDLERRIRRNPPSFAERLEIVAQVCNGLAHAHRNGIVHRDIKPANIFVVEGGGVIIMDFGVARWMQSSQTQTGAVLGTADYMSPEQIRGQKVDGRSDIFSVGIILFRLLTNKKPFTGENIQATFYKILSADPPLLMLPDGRQVDELQGIVDRALAKEFDERYDTAEEMADDIKAFLRIFEGVLAEDTIFDVTFDPETKTPDDTSRPGIGGTTGRRPGRTGSGRLSRTQPGGMGRTARGTSPPPTAAGRLGERTAAAPTGRTALVGRTAVVPATRYAPVPAQKRSSGGLYALLGVVVLGAAAGGYWFVSSRAGPDTAAATTSSAAPSPEVLDSRFEFAESLLEKGQIAQAFEVVQNILTIAPDNDRALALQARIEEASAQGKTAPAPTQTTPSPQVGGTPSRSGKAQALAADAALAIAGGELGQARSLIAQGRRADPSNPRWDQLSRQLQQRSKELQQQASDKKRAEVVSGYLQQAAKHIEAGDYDMAIAAYDSALKQDPNNAAAFSGKAQAAGLKQQLELARKRQEELQQKASMALTRRFEESRTEFKGPGGQEGSKGFETSDGVQVKKATGAPTFPAEIIIELNPPNAQPGQPYVLRIRVHNEGNRPIHVKTIELVSSYGGKAIGRGQQIPTRTQRVNPRSTAVLLEVQSTWTEEQNQGSLVATVSLVGGGTLTKSLRW